ncbi:phytoene desaturase family protein [Ferruginibacter sp. SUN002]|uniref:phytoene desaturase family protein n=1 Tax=Ferruginibacter sp. SUN002 TaxID=2937789 RepID=UPI003D36264E
MKKAIIIGSGFAGISAACYLAKAGWQVVVLEKHETAGGRARQLKENGFTFDMGPSWYWMPEVFETFFQSFGKRVDEFYKLQRLDPSYRVYYQHDYIDIPADYEALKKTFESIEPGSAVQLDQFLKEAAFKYEVGINKLVYKPGQSLTEFIDWDIIKGVFKLDVLTDMKKHIRKFFKNKKLQELMEFPVLFLGALPQNTPALYSLMNYADIKLGTWYPKGGMYEVVKAMQCLAEDLGVKFYFNHNVEEIKIEHGIAKGVVANGILHQSDVVISGADYHFTETRLLPENCRTYSDEYWRKRTMAPSCLLYYIGINKKLKNTLHHSLFFDKDFEVHGNEIYTDPKWPTEPLFYVSATSVTDSTVAPEGCENLFFLIPVAAGLKGDTEELRDAYFEKIVGRFEAKTGEKIKSSIIYKKSYSVSNFINDYNAFKGNAYGLANTLKQTAILKPSCQSKKIKNLFYTGQLTVPGPGVPPSLISGKVVAEFVLKQFD